LHAEYRKRTPSDRQHWDFVIVTNPAQLQELSTVWRGARPHRGAPAAIALVSYLLGVGYPADRPLTPIVKPDRRPFTEVVHRGRW
jgi:nitroreductase